MIKNNKKSTIGLLFIVLFIGALILMRILNNNKSWSISETIKDMPEKETIEKAIGIYLEESKKRQDFYGSTPESKLFCAASIHWQKDISSSEKIVFAANECENVILVDGDLRSVSGGRGSSLFKVQKINNDWKVVDRDSRMVSPTQPITQNWVGDAEKIIPSDVKLKYTCLAMNCFTTEGVIKKAAEYFQIKLPLYPLNPCKGDSDCSKDSVCVLSGVTNPGPSICVKKCTANKDCGIAHTCRGKCVRGENSCPKTKQYICTPDLPYREKDPNGIIK